jgi:hypothetical protein
MELTRKDMDHLNEDALRELIELSATPSLTIYMPTHRRSVETEQDPIRLKNLLSEVETELLGTGMRRPEVVRFLKPLQSLLEDHGFWQHQSDGLAIFRTFDRLLTYRLPIGFAELTVVGQRPHIKPLLPLITADGHFYLLALSQNQVRFFNGTRFQVGEIELVDTPASLEDAMRFDDFESQLQFQTGTGTSTGAGRAAVFHGHSDASDEAVVKENIKRFLNRVDQGVRNQVTDQRTPLVLAGVDSIRGLYREVGQYANIVDAGIDGNPEMMDASELHARAWPLIEPLFTKAQQEAVDGYLHLAGTDDPRASSDLKEIVSGAYFQRVDTLFIPVGLQQWGAFDPEQNRVHVHADQESGDFDLFDFAAIHTLLNGGSVYAMQPEHMPGDQSVAAIFRYA